LTHRREVAIGAVYALLLLVLGAAAPTFFDPAHLRDLLVGAAPLLLAAIGMTLVILARQIDISIGSQFAICAVVAGLLAKQGLPMPLTGAGAIAAGGLLGAVNGALVAGLGLPAIVVTLAMMVGLREALRWTTEGVWVRELPEGFQWMGVGQDAGRIAIPALALAVWVVATFAMRHVAAGRAIYATGSDPEVARLAGMRPRRVVFWVFVAMGALTGLAALVSAIQFIDVQTNSGVGFELRVIAAVVVGGTAIAGGRGSLVGTLLGVLLLATAGPALVFLGTQAYWDRALQGLIILAAVAADAFGPTSPAASARQGPAARRGARS
jgi:ribose/xylose/arabinose/galactoside ABC-type transport system permease subunit